VAALWPGNEEAKVTARTNPTRHLVTRRDALAALTAAVVGTACTPVRAVLGLYPKPFEGAPDREARVLAAFVTAVVPGVSPRDPNLIRVFYDDYYPLAKYRALLISNLCSRTSSRHGTLEFDRLTLEQRTEMIDDGLHGGGVIARLYGGAVFLAQLSSYSGMYDIERGSPLIDFPGRFRPRPLTEIGYANPERFLAPALTADGNPS
jgi:hypothetical protein